MKKIKKLLSVILVFAMILSVVPAISVEAKSGVIKKTVKKKFVIEKFDDQEDIDDLGFTEKVDFVNQCGGWYGVVTKKGFVWDEEEVAYVEASNEGTYLTIWAGMTVAQAARSLKNMYGKYSCITKADLKNNDKVTSYWVKAKLYKIAKKRHCTKYEETVPISDAEKEEYITKHEYAYMIKYFIECDSLLDPRESHKY